MLLSFGLVVGVTACDGSSTSGTTDDTTSSSTGENITIESVTIVDSDGNSPETAVTDNQGFQLSANVVSNSTSTASKRVTWSVDNEDIASVTNGYVEIYNLGMNNTAELTVTATSNIDETKKDSVTFSITHCPIDLNNSRPLGQLDAIAFLDDGVISQPETSMDTAMIYADVYMTDFIQIVTVIKYFLI